MILEINTQLSRPIYEQLRDQIILGIAGGQLAAGEGLPSVRRLAADLGINLHTANKAYTLLCGEGYIVMDRRRGATIADVIPADGQFEENLLRSLSLAAAEAVCRGIGEEDFTRLCLECYQKTCGNGDGRGKNERA